MLFTFSRLTASEDVIFEHLYTASQLLFNTDHFVQLLDVEIYKTVQSRGTFFFTRRVQTSINKGAARLNRVVEM